MHVHVYVTYIVFNPLGPAITAGECSFMKTGTPMDKGKHLIKLHG